MSLSYQNLKTRFHKIMIDHGKDVFLRRRCSSCSQTGAYAKFPDDCEECGGVGYVQTLERYTMRKQIVGTQGSWPNTLHVFPTGVILGEGCYFFCEAEVLPKYGDLIYDQDSSTNEWTVYEVNKALERRYDSRVLFWNLACDIREGSAL